MEDFIIIGIVFVLFGYGLVATKKHFKRKSGCCGSDTYKAKGRKLNQVIGKKIAYVEGMSCQHCVNRVIEALNRLEYASAKVNLNKGIVTISLEKEISDDVIISTIEKAGYKVNSIV